MNVGRAAGLSDTGRRRRRNEDSYVCRPPLFAVADGMGGAQAGEVASKLAAEALDELESGRGEECVAGLIREANRRVFQRASEDPAASGMGTTMTVLLVDAPSGSIAVGHVGDSRAYRIRDGELEQLTDDHSLVGELMRSGRLTPEEAETHPQRSVITRALGTESDVDVDTFTVEARPGDVYLLCSDGLSTMVGDAEILDLVRTADDPARAARSLVDAANRGGGEDNVTVVLFEISEEGGDTALLAPPESASTVDEDTLDPLDAVPAVDTAVVPVDEVRAHVARERAAGRRGALPPTASRHGAGEGSRWPALLALVLAVGLVLALVAWGLLR